MSLRTVLVFFGVLIVGMLVFAACTGPAPQAGPEGPAGPQGPAGPEGPAGPAGDSLTDEQATAVAVAANLGFISTNMEEVRVRRGCPACHVLVDQDTGKYTLPFEAHDRVEARGAKHPEVAPDGTSIKPTDDVNVTVCLQCHGAGTGDREDLGNLAPIALRDIVHPAHMSSQYFKLHYGGNCFTCHNIGGDGNWDLLTEKVDVNDKGVPADYDSLPIPGAIEITP
jgi:hypothetical protein